MNRARLLLIRAGIIILAFFGVAFLWLISDAMLPESVFVKALFGAWSVALFFLFWDFSMQLGEPGGLLNRRPGDDGPPSSSLSHQLETESTSQRASDLNKDSKSLKELETTRGLATIDDRVLDSVAAELEAERRDEELWAKLLTTVDGADARREAIDIRLKAKRLQRKVEEERLKAEQRRSDAEGTRRARKGLGATMGSGHIA